MNGNLMKIYGLERFFLMVMIVLLVFAWTPAHSATASEEIPRIQDVLIVEKKGRLMAFMSLKDAFTSKLLEIVHSGVTTRFTFEIALMRGRPLIYDSIVKKQTLVHQVKYDTLKKAYTFSSKNGTDEKTQKITKNRAEMVDWMSEINGHAVMQVRDVEPGEGYYLQVRAKLNSVDFAFPFNYMLGFLDEKTPWVSSLPFNAGGM